MSKLQSKSPEASTRVRVPAAFPLRELINAGYCMNAPLVGNKKEMTIVYRSRTSVNLSRNIRRGDLMMCTKIYDMLYF